FHVGLDFNDIEKFGTAENIIKQKKFLQDANDVIADVAVALFVSAGVAIAADSKKVKNTFAIISGVTGIVSFAADSAEALLLNVAAEGFRAWLILQHYYGCKPFITEMKKTVNLINEQL
ncbi:hypothetical protein, partial [Treponema sp. R6D11]